MTMNTETDSILVIKVSGESRIPTVAGAIAKQMREHHEAVVQAIGAKAVNQTVKALAVARSYLVEDGIELVFIPTLVDLEIDGDVRTVVRFQVEKR